MLRPIKSFLNYLNLNTNVSSLGSPSSTMNADTCEVLPSTTTTAGPGENVETDNTISASASVSSTKTPHDQNENEVIAAIDDGTKLKVTKDTTEEDDDVVIVTKERPVIDLTDNDAATSRLKEPRVESTDLADDDNDGQDNEELGRAEVTIAHEDGTSNASDEEQEIFSIATNVVAVTDDTETVICDNNGQDELDGSRSELLDLSLESNEVVILDEIDPNDSITDPLNDPLAIDDYNADISSNIAPNCGGTAPCDTSAEGEILFTIDTRQIISNNALGKTSNSRHKRRDNYVVAATTEEHEARSDGSDSGLGSETSTLQSANTSLAMDSPVSKPTPLKSNLKRRLDVSLTDESPSIKKQKKTLQFNGVKVYYFPRIQGFGCVPSQGGCTLGMAAQHIQFKTFTLAEHTAEQRRVHKQQMQVVNPRSSSSDDTDSEEEISEASGSDLDADANGFLQPVPARQRRAILKAAGIRKIDPSEKNDCRAIRTSREFCGCNCRGYCDPDTCSCSQAGIKCQVDRPNFPCGCTRDGCANVIGRVEFNPSRVRTHYIHTIMRLDLENKQKRPMRMETPSSVAMLSYGSNSVTSSNLCSYNSIVNTNHMRSHQQMYSSGVSITGPTLQQQSMGSYANDGLGVYPNQMQIDRSSHLQHRLPDSGSGGDGSLNTPQSHDVDLQYTFRVEANENVELVSHGSNPGNILALGDYQPTNPLYHEVYNGHSFLSPNYTNSNFCQPHPSEYQQSFLGFSSPTTNNSVDIADLTVGPPIDGHDSGTICSDPSYTSLNSPIGNQSRVDAINDLLQNSRTVSAKVTTECVSKSISYNMPSSAQTSTSITEGTMTTMSQPQIRRPSLSLNPLETVLTPVVDLTDGRTEQVANVAKCEPIDDVIEVKTKSNLVDLTERDKCDKRTDDCDVNVAIESINGNEVKIDVDAIQNCVKKEESLQTDASKEPNATLSSVVASAETDVKILKTASVSSALSVVSVASTDVDVENRLVEGVIA